MKSTLERYNKKLNIPFDESYVRGLMEGFDVPYDYTEHKPSIKSPKAEI